jgi:hypothetical protein
VIRRTSGLVAIVWLALLAGCGGGDGGSTPTSPPPPPPVDTTPNTFTFPAQSGVALSAVVASDEIVVSGLNAAATIAVTGGEYSINGGAFTAAAGTVAEGQRIQVRVTGANQFSATSSAVLTVGGISATFTATTVAADTTPDAFSFTSQSGVTPATVLTSDDVVITGMNTSAPVTITGGEYCIDGGSFTAAAGSIGNNQHIRVRVTASTQFSTTASAALSVGTASASFSATTVPADRTPDAFSFASRSAIPLSTVVTSDEITISGMNTTASVTISGGEYSIDDGAFSALAGSVANNQRIRVRLTSSAQFTTTVSAALTVGTVSASFAATTWDPDPIPDAFQIARKTGGTRDAWVSSDAVAIAGINTGSPITVENGEYSLSGGAFTSTPGLITPGQSFVVRTRAASTYSKNTQARITIGTVSANFDVLSELPNYLPDGIAYDGQDVVYLLSAGNGLLFRWSVGESRYLDPYTVGYGGAAPTSMTYLAAHHRVYLGYASGAIRQIEVSAASPVEAAFAVMPGSVSSLGSAGNFLVAQVNSGYNGGYLLNASGVVTGQGGYYYGYSRETAWDPVTSRVYFTRDGLSPNDLHYDVVDQATGTVSSAGETPYHGAYNIQAPIRVSVDGVHVLLGSGDIYTQATLNWVGSLGTTVDDARWFANGSLVTLTTSGNNTTLRRLAATGLQTLEQNTYTGQALRVVGTDTRMAVVVAGNTTVQIYTYVPNDDVDGDGVANTEDAFPLDGAASVDTDRDGYPDAWNAGKSQSDSTTGLTLDAFAQDSACWLAAHGSGGVCNYAATMPDYTPDEVVQNGDVIYLLSSINKRVYRWSIAAGAYLNPYVVGINQGFTTVAPTKMAYASSNQRLYLGYSTGAIRYIDTAGSPAEVPFANTALAVNGLASVGKFVLAQDSSGAWATHYIFNSAGALADQADWNYYSREYAWDPVNSRVYFFRDDTSPDDLHYEVINQTTGEITSAGETPYHGTYAIQPPIRVSADGQNVLLGSGDIYTQPVLNWSGSLGAQVVDARWLADGSLVTLTSASHQTTLRRLASASLAVLEQRTFTGDALRVFGTDTSMVVLVINGGIVQFQRYVPDDDSDDDGVINTQDAFPLDVAASVDSDHDGYPDSWNAGKSQADSTTGLSLDAFPQDSACWLPAHGSGGVCNNAATIPNFVPDKIVHKGDVIYLLSNANKRVYRWSISGSAYLNPYIVGINQGFTTVAPVTMEYSVAHQRLYLGYGTGAIRYIDVNGSSAEVPFATMAAGVTSLSSAGNFLAAQVSIGYSGGFLLNSSGAVTGQGGYYYGYSRETAWDPVNSRLYYFRDGISPNDLHYDVVNQTTGQVTATGETPYHGDYSFGGVIRVSANGASILLGTGDLYAEPTMTWSGSLGSQLADARWLTNGSVVTLTTSGNQTSLRRLGSTNFALLEQSSFTGQALGVFGTDTSMVVVVLNNGTVQFRAYVPNNDSDADGIANTLDAFPLDVAASVDSDRDGYPDAWNAGRSQADSTTGLVLDAFAQDSACWLAAHGSGGVCNYGATVPNYIPDKVVQQGDVVYLLSKANNRVYRWSISGGAYLNPYVVGINQGFGVVAPVTIEYSAAHHRLYTGYSTGGIRYLDVNASNPAEVAFATPGSGLNGLTSAGNFLVAHATGSYGTSGSYVINSSGVTTGTGTNYYYYSADHAWDPVNSRLYYVTDGSGSYALYYEVIDQTTGLITSTGNSVYNSSIINRAPARVSVNGQYILTGSGDFFAQSGLTWAGSLGAQIVDARWFANGSVATLTTANNQTVLRRLGSSNLTVLEQRSFTGQALRVLGSDTLMTVLVIDNGAVQFRSYVPNDDSDGDGVTNTADAFPLDAAASVDTDRDGYPDSWNAGKSQSDSTTGLVLDAFPTESACWLAAHGSGGICNFGATIPNYTPDQVAQQGNTVYLLSGANKRVYRWSLATGAYLSPYVVGLDLGLSTSAPTTMAYSSSQQRLYLGYGNGVIRYIDVTGGGTEVTLTTMNGAVTSLSSAGNFLLAQVNGGYGYGSGYVLNASGVTTGQSNNYYGYSRETAWDAATSRIYYLRDGGGYGTFLYDVIDQTTGAVTSSGESVYTSNYSVAGPIRLSADGQQILLGSGDIYARTGLARSGSLGKAVIDAQWKDNLIVDVDNTDQVEIRDASTRTVLQTYQYLGQPLRVLFGTSEGYLMHVMNGTTSFVRMAFYDGDADQIARWFEQRYGLNDANAADALTDLDGDGVNNRTEFLNLSNPTSSDTDADGLDDFQEIVTYHTLPGKADSDGDGLNDYAEAITYHSDPLDTDSDNDGYNDLDEVLYGGDPNDATGLPQPMFNYSQTFEGSPNLAAWTSPALSNAPWAVDATNSHAGSASFKSGPIAASQNSSVRFRGFFRPGTLSFWARVDPGYCCNRMYVFVDGLQVQYISGGLQWNSYTIQIPLGIHEFEWRFERDFYGAQTSDAAWIDDVVFTGQ